MSLKESLSKIKDKDNKNDLNAHLQNLLTKILLDDPKNIYENFEQLSIEFKNHQDFDKASRLNVNFEEISENAEKTTKLIGKINVGTPDEPQEPGPCGYVPNMMEESRWFEQAGVGFGAEETYKIFKSLTLFSVTKQVKQIRLWGKIMGSQKDYYVAEGQADSAVDDGELPANVEPRGTGVNRLNYWVTTDILSGEWIELPLLYPHHIEVSRRIRYIFTGNLEANVITNPFFFGKEKHLLKAQIVRISHSTSIQPKGMQILREGEEREVDQAEDYKLPNFHTLKSIDSWVHTNPSILKCGRLTLQLPADLDPEKDAAVELKLLEAQDPYEPRLKPVVQDQGISSIIYNIEALNGPRAGWKLKIMGDCSDYNPLLKDQTQKINYGVIVLKSLVWPGLVTVVHNKQWQQLYVGYGFKQSEQQFYPKEPQQLQVEVIDKDEQPEPNFPPEVVQQPQD